MALPLASLPHNLFEFFEVETVASSSGEQTNTAKKLVVDVKKAPAFSKTKLNAATSVAFQSEFWTTQHGHPWFASHTVENDVEEDSAPVAEEDSTTGAGVVGAGVLGAGVLGAGVLGAGVFFFLQQDLKHLLTLAFFFLWHFIFLMTESLGGAFFPSFRLMHLFTPAVHFFLQSVAPFFLQ